MRIIFPGNDLQLQAKQSKQRQRLHRLRVDALEILLRRTRVSPKGIQEPAVRVEGSQGSLSTNSGKVELDNCDTVDIFWWKIDRPFKVFSSQAISLLKIP
jgi:hypothetical protein